MSQAFGIAGFGLGFGVVHVLTGPDHLSALATLAANDARAFWLGVQWGVGHSIGLVVVATILLAVSHAAKEGEDENEINVSEELSHILETCVGVFMILLGSYGVFSAYRKKQDGDECAVHRPLENMDEEMENAEEGLDQLELRELNDDDPSPPESEFSIGDTEEGPDQLELKELNDGDQPQPEFSIGDTEEGPDPLELRELNEGDRPPPEFNDGDPPRAPPREENGAADSVNRDCLRAAIAVCVGIVHGVAGPGGVLGVMPAVQLRQWGLAFLYLGCFCASATLTMGCFAAGYGKCSSRLGASRVCRISAFRIELLSASLSIFVGVMWLTLLYLGILEKVFP